LYLSATSALALQPVGPKAGAPAPQEAAPSQPPPSAPPSGAPGGGSTLVLLMPLLVLMVVMLFMGRNQKKKDAEMRAKLKKGDRITSQSGLVGELVDMDERFAKVKLGPGITVQMLVSTIQPLDPSLPAKADDKLKDLKDAKATADKK